MVSSFLPYFCCCTNNDEGSRLKTEIPISATADEGHAFAPIGTSAIPNLERSFVETPAASAQYNNSGRFSDDVQLCALPPPADYIEPTLEFAPPPETDNGQLPHEQFVDRGQLPIESTLCEDSQRNIPEAQADVHEEFRISFGRDATKSLGIDIDKASGHSVVLLRVFDGPMQVWNEEHPDRQVKHADRIMELNGVRGDSKLMIDRLKADPVLEMTIRRPISFTAVGLVRTTTNSGSSESKVGLELIHSSGLSLLVKKINPGIIADWNARQQPSRQVKIGDRIVQVNACNDNSEAMFQLIAQSTHMDISFSRNDDA